MALKETRKDHREFPKALTLGPKCRFIHFREDAVRELLQIQAGPHINFKNDEFHKALALKYSKSRRTHLQSHNNTFAGDSIDHRKWVKNLIEYGLLLKYTSITNATEPPNNQPTLPQESRNRSTSPNRTPDILHPPEDASFDVEMGTRRTIGVEMEFGNDDSEVVGNFGPQGQRVTRKCSCQSAICVVAIALAPITMMLGMTAKEGDEWKFAFLTSSGCWLMVCAIGIYLDLRALDKPTFVRRGMWHLGLCVVMLYFFMSVLKIGSESLPQWLPTIIDAGLGASVGTQNIPPNTREKLRDYVANLLGSICGGTQVVVQGREQLLPQNETTRQ